MKHTREQLAERLHAQNEEFQQVVRDLKTLGDVKLAVPVDALEELEAALSGAVLLHSSPNHFLRG